MKSKGWLGRGVRITDVDPPPKVHVVEHEVTLCGAPRGPYEIEREAFRTFRLRVVLCDACDDVIWGIRSKAKGTADAIE